MLGHRNLKTSQRYTHGAVTTDRLAILAPLVGIQLRMIHISRPVGGS